MDDNGRPINAHPLCVTESRTLAVALDTSDELKQNFLKPEGLLPSNMLYINPDRNGYAIWQTPKQRVNIFFAESLGIPNGRTNIPALIWKAGRNELSVYALGNGRHLDGDTILYRAPFFNIYENGRVCMGTVTVNIHPDCMLEAFMKQWETYFFGSYFSHLLGNISPVKGNIVQLWQTLVNSHRNFPVRQLVKNGLTLKNLIQ